MRNRLIRFSFNAKLRRKVYIRLAKQLRYNVSLLFSLNTLLEQNQKNKNTLLVNMYTHIIEQYESGRDFSLTLKNYIPYDELMLIQAGESSGNLQEGFLLASKIIDAKKKIKSSLRSAVASPALLLSLVIILLIIVSFMVIPNFALISDPNLWTGSAYVLYLVSSLITSPFGILLGISFLASICILIYSLPNLTGNVRVKLDKYPPYSMYRLTIGATWLFTTASLIQSGMQLNDILKMMIQSDVNSLYLKERLHAILDNYGGKKFGEALALTKMDFPDAELVDDIKTYSSLPNFEETLYQIAEEWLVEGVEKIEENAKIFSTISLCLITSVVIGIIMAFQNIQQTMIQGV